MPYHPVFNVGAGDPISGLYACMARTLLGTELSPQSWEFFYVNVFSLNCSLLRTSIAIQLFSNKRRERKEEGEKECGESLET